MRTVLACLLCTTPGLALAQGQVNLDGFFIATDICPAFQSKNNQTNPGGMTTEIMRAYDMIAINKAGGDFYQVRMPDAPVTTARWVSVDCGLHAVAAEGQDRPRPATAPDIINGASGPEWTTNMLTLSWQPAFCETESGQEKMECVTLNAGGLESAATRLSIHGLWPQPRGVEYCGDAAPWKHLDKRDDDEVWEFPPIVEMDDDTRAALAELMPGVTSRLDRHEWMRHGTCYRAAGGSDEYYDDTLMLTRAINDSGLADLLASRVGAIVTMAEIHDVIDDAFGAGASEAVEVKCFNDDGRNLLGEIWIALEGVIEPGADIGQLMRDSDGRTTDADCLEVTVDPTGLED